MRTDEDGKPFLFSKFQYRLMHEKGFFEGERVELLNGRVYMNELTNPLSTYEVQKVVEIFRRGLGSDFCVRPQRPVDLSNTSEPVPDISIVEFERGGPVEEPVLLIVEMELRSLKKNRLIKSDLYAGAKAQEYWIVDSAERRIEVNRDPGPCLNRDGWEYRANTTHGDGEFISPLAKPDLRIAVSDLLPPKK